jgi:hypothetical protein
MNPMILVVRQDDGLYQVTVWTGDRGITPAFQAENLPPEKAAEMVRDAFGTLELAQRIRQATFN